MIDNFDTFLAWESRCRDTIDFKKTYVYMANNDLVSGLLLSQIIYYYLPSKSGEKNKLRIEKHGYLWIAKAREDWWDEICISPKQFDHASSNLVDVGLIEKKVMKFDNNPTVHIRIIEENFMKAWSDASNPLLTKGKKGNSVLVNNKINQSVNSFNIDNNTDYNKENTALPPQSSSSTSTKQNVNGDGEQGEDMVKDKRMAQLDARSKRFNAIGEQIYQNNLFSDNRITKWQQLSELQPVLFSLDGFDLVKTLKWKNKIQSDGLWTNEEKIALVDFIKDVENEERAIYLQNTTSKNSFTVTYTQGINYLPPAQDLYGKSVVVNTKDHLVNTNKMIAPQSMANHFPDTGNMVTNAKAIMGVDLSGGQDKAVFATFKNGVLVSTEIYHEGMAQEQLSFVASNLADSPQKNTLGYSTPQTMVNNAFNEKKRIIGQNSVVSKPVKPADKPTKLTIAKQPDLAQEFLKRWCEEVLCYGKRDEVTGTYDKATYAISWPMEKKGVKVVLANGYTFEDMKAHYQYLKPQTFWQTKHLTIQMVMRDLLAWIQAGRPSSQVVAKPQWQVANDANDLLWNELVSLTGGVKCDGTRVPMKYGRNDANIAKSKMSKGLLALLQRMTASGRYSELLDMSDEQMEFTFKKAVKVMSKE